MSSLSTSAIPGVPAYVQIMLCSMYKLPVKKAKKVSLNWFSMPSRPSYVMSVARMRASASAIALARSHFNIHCVIASHIRKTCARSPVTRHCGCGLWPHTTNHATLPPHKTYMDLSVDWQVNAQTSTASTTVYIHAGKHLQSRSWVDITNRQIRSDHREISYWTLANW